jgi:hypothetical protein
VAYTGVDGSGNIYRLDISGGAKNEAGAGDSYELTITYSPLRFFIKKGYEDAPR